ncbi:vWA domain-containing protein [Sporosarcina koreensis]|uniref:vWA domain-containing protein n=1 Tax=Sporosarcina koreensis TaxID=334735 RepID=UPI00058C3FD9|nr:BatA and WFA domain-containing protein [Sporosarcina koreensis]
MGFANLYNSWTLIFPALLILYYLFRKRFYPQPVSSTLFWQPDRKEEHVSPFIRNLQRNALFYLQLLALLLFVWLLLGPYMKQDRTTGVPLVIVVDRSAAMLAAPDGEPLFDRHLREMHKLLDETQERPVTIIASGPGPETITSGQSVSAAAASLEGLTVNYADPSLRESVALARTLLGGKEGEVHIFTDKLDREEFSEETGETEWHVHANGDRADNQSIVRFGAVRRGGAVTAIAKLQNDADAELPGIIRLLDAVTGEQLAQQQVTGKPGEDEYITFKDIVTEAPAVTAELESADQYSADNTAFALLETGTPAVTVDTELHELLKKAVEAVRDDILIDDGKAAVPEDALRITRSSDVLAESRRPVLLFGRDDETAAEAEGSITVQEDPLFAIAPPTDMYVKEVYPPYDKYEVLAKVGEAPLIQRSPDGDIVFLADLESTDWPLQPSFPLFIWSAVHSLADGSESLGVFTPGQRKNVILSSAADLYDMDDSYISSTESANTLQAPVKPGIYKAADTESEKLLAVQLSESQHSVRTGDSYIAGKLGETAEHEQETVPILWPFVLPLLLLMSAEWEVQRRRGYPY